MRNERWEEKKKLYSTFTIRKSIFPLGHTVFTQMCYCTAQIRIDSFVSCDLFISPSTGLWVSVILMENQRLYYQVIRLCQALFILLSSLFKGKCSSPDGWEGLPGLWCSLCLIYCTFKITVAGKSGTRWYRAQIPGKAMIPWVLVLAQVAWGLCRLPHLAQVTRHCRIVPNSLRRIYSASTNGWFLMFPVQCLIGRERWVMWVPAVRGKFTLTEVCESDHTERTLSHILLLWASRAPLPICIWASVTVCGHLFVRVSVSSSIRVCVPLGQRPGLRLGLRPMFNVQLKQSMFV